MMFFEEQLARASDTLDQLNADALQQIKRLLRQHHVTPDHADAILAWLTEEMEQWKADKLAELKAELQAHWSQLWSPHERVSVH